MMSRHGFYSMILMTYSDIILMIRIITRNETMAGTDSDHRPCPDADPRTSHPRKARSGNCLYSIYPCHSDRSIVGKVNGKFFG